MAQTLYLMSFLNDNKARSENTINYQDDLHLTVVSNFTVPNRNMIEFRRGLLRLTPWFFPLELEIVDHVTLGTIREVPAAIVRAKSLDFNLKQMHDSFLELIAQFKGTVNDGYSGSQYTPHITYLNSYKPITLSNLTLVEHTEGFGRGIRTSPIL